jgi:hypothetical protein
VNYTDAENDMPGSITVTIDGGTSVNITAKAGQDGDFTNGEIYQITINGASLGGGTHTFHFTASDGIDNATGDIGSHSGPTVTMPPPPPGGGGGGGGIQPGVTSVLQYLTQTGRFTEDVTAKSEDRKVQLYIPKDTIGQNRLGSLLSSISIKQMDEPPSPPEGYSVIGPIYRLGPDRATFDPPIDLTIKYNQSQIPEGVSKARLVVASFDTYDKTASEWEVLESTVDPESDTITTKVSHFSAMAVLAPTGPANFKFTELVIKPKEVKLGQSVHIIATITNIGDLAGSYEVSLIIDGIAVQSKEITLNSGESDMPSFSVIPDVVGIHTVNIGDLEGTFMVKELEPATFTTSSLAISPAEVNIGEETEIKVTVTNIGDITGTYELSLKINGAIALTKEVTLDPGTSIDVVFITTEDTAGVYSVEANELRGTFTVTEEVPSVPSAPSIPQTPPPLPSPMPTPAPASENNWWLIGYIIGGVAAVILISYLLVSKYSPTMLTRLALHTSRLNGQELWSWFQREVLKKQ